MNIGVITERNSKVSSIKDVFGGGEGRGKKMRKRYKGGGISLKTKKQREMKYSNYLFINYVEQM